MKPKHYSPAINRLLVSALYHEAKGRGLKMTALVNQLLAEALTGSSGWQQAMKQLEEQSRDPGAVSI